ncbi:MAG: hypothetical protein ACRCXB_26175 [Aeromonadaceae bacterium]
MSKDIDGVDFVTDNNTGGYFVMECQNCGEVFNSKYCNGGEANADAGDFGDCYCPHCEEVDPMECDNANLVWNVQQKKINQLNQKRDELLSALEMVIADKAPGYHDCIDDGEQECAWCVARAAIAKAKGGAA